MTKYIITSRPYATQTGTLEIPDDVSGDAIYEYAEDHWYEIDFGEPNLDYGGTDFDMEEE